MLECWYFNGLKAFSCRIFSSACMYGVNVFSNSIDFSLEGAGLVLDWEQESGMLLASGDVRIIRIWDSQRETKVQVKSTDPD